MTQVYALADDAGRYRALILLATFASLRWAELAALRPEDVDLKACTVRVTRQIDYLPGAGHSFGPPKSRAALIYLHSSAGRQRPIADQIGKSARAALSKSAARPKPSGTRKTEDQGGDS